MSPDAHRLTRNSRLETCMPELAEVEHGRRVAERIALGRTIVEADVADDDIVVHGTTWSEVRDAAMASTRS